MARAAAVRDPGLFASINVTPFIDVLLVLLIMLIMTIPVATNKLPIDLPRPGGAPLPDEPHTLAIDRSGALFWDGRAVGDAQLPGLLAAIRQRPQAVLQMQTDPMARFERFDVVLATVKRAGITRLGFVASKPLDE